jgi:hypothetical protein
VVDELERAGIERANMHTIARGDVDITGLPRASDAQRKDRVWFWEQVFWTGNLALFGLSLLGCVLALWEGSVAGLIFSLLVVMVTFLLGNRFAVVTPHVHLDEMRVPLLHGEVVLMVDLPRARVEEIEQLISRHHPEAGVGGVGWTLASMGI